MRAGGGIPRLERNLNLFYRSIRVADVDGVVKLFATGAIMHDHVGAPPHSGHEGVRAFLTGVWGMCERFDISALETIYFENSAAVTWAAYAIGKNGARLEFGAIDVLRFNDNMEIVSLHAFWDPGPVLTALRQVPITMDSAVVPLGPVAS